MARVRKDQTRSTTTKPWEVAPADKPAAKSPGATDVQRPSCGCDAISTPAPVPSCSPIGERGAVSSTPMVRGNGSGKVHTVRFGANWNNQFPSNMEVKRGGTLHVEWDPSRAKLRTSRNGLPAWGVDAWFQFEPGGKVITRKAVDFENVYGRPIDKPVSVSIDVRIPEDAKAVKVWFRNWTGADQPGEWFDSNFGNNYVFRVVE